MVPSWVSEECSYNNMYSHEGVSVDWYDEVLRDYFIN